MEIEEVNCKSSASCTEDLEKDIVDSVQNSVGGTPLPPKVVVKNLNMRVRRPMNGWELVAICVGCSTIAGIVTTIATCHYNKKNGSSSSEE